jgi:hypothetical protein
MSAFLLGDIIFALAWILLFVFCKKTRKLQLFGSLLLLPFGFLDIWFRMDNLLFQRRRNCVCFRRIIFKNKIRANIS